MKSIDAVLTQIAQQHLGIETLAARNADRSDFHDVAVGSLREALEAAYRTGQTQSAREPKAVKTRQAGTQKKGSK